MASGTQSLDRGEKKEGTTPPAELQSLKTENGIRADQGIPLCPAFYDKNNSEK
jgi:hypothetical protein